MSNVVSLRRPGGGPLLPAVPALVEMLALRRRNRHDPFWLKENAELLQILAATGARDVDLSPLEGFSRALMSELRFFPQYYRLFLSMAVDMAALGLPGVPALEMADHVISQGLAEAELSDTHRKEVDLLLRRAGADVPVDQALEDRLHRFARASHLFCLPNRRAAYDLTHIVFHACDYGRKTLAPDAARRLGLIHVGMVAWLEENLDLLAEVVLALSFSGEAVPENWQRAISRGVGLASFAPGFEGARFDDDYHQYLVLNWAMTTLGGMAFEAGVPQNARLIQMPKPLSSALRELSLALMELGDERRADWATMRWRLWPGLSAAARQRVEAIEALPEFEGFFQVFARAGLKKGV